MHAKSGDKHASTHAPEPSPGAPRRWWQWFLLYPGLAIAVVGAVPTYIEAFKAHTLGVAFGRSFDAEEQNRLWQENFECAQRASFTAIVNKKKVEIGSTVCESGDVLLQGKRPEWERPQLRWVSWNEVAPHEAKRGAAWLDALLSPAHASDRDSVRLAQVTTSVLCQKWLGQGQILQRVKTSSGCVDQTVNTYNGWVISSREAPCSSSC